MLKFKLAFTAIVALFAASCANGALTPTETATVDSVLSYACPAVALASGFTKDMNATEKKGYKVLVSVCPPNPAPTNLAVAVSDLIAAYDDFKTFKVKKKVVHA